MDEVIIFIIFAVVLFVTLIGFAKFNAGIDDSWRQQIVEHGCAEFYLDGKNERQWRWKDGTQNH